MGGGRELADQWEGWKAWHPRERRRYKGTAFCGMGSVVVLLQYNLNMKFLVGDRNRCCGVCKGVAAISLRWWWLLNPQCFIVNLKKDIAHTEDESRIYDSRYYHQHYVLQSMQISDKNSGFGIYSSISL